MSLTPPHLRERHEWRQWDYLDLRWPKTYIHPFSGEVFEIPSLREYMKRQRLRHPDRVFKVIKDQIGHEIKWRIGDPDE